MAQYIPPHARGASSPDKSHTTQTLTDIFEPRVPISHQNVTIRRSSVINNFIESNKTKAESENESTENDPDSDLTPVSPQLLTVLKSIDQRLANQGATLDKMTISQNVMQKSIDFGHANSSDLKDRIVVLEKENTKLIAQNSDLESQGRDMTRRLDNIEQQLAQLDHNNRRRNIIIDGVQESEGENTMDIRPNLV